ncbi:hypothetical protein JAAARDRAFT_27728 [Jaapia argillacea MUCL 33604]|uniref:XRRM domain-containing protein n=1 Tax=Jaapia argillacea MUCL 33604 TaxID=933084 RepID=A0A067QKQ7_9AGAM|nr:hypothetical protein JAAARDRAFT_27728 [Jaapia argillacea MUCL 33604]
MSTGFQFVPRKLGKASQNQGRTRRLPAGATVVSSRETVESPKSSIGASEEADGFEPREAQHYGTQPGGWGKGKEKETDMSIPQDDYGILISLALSDYALWSEPDLRRTIESNSEGFIPLSFIFQHSPYFAHISNPSELLAVKSIRALTSDVGALEVRMLVSSPSRANWYKKEVGNVRDVLGGHEVRRSDWVDMVERVGGTSRDFWEKRCVSLENIPAAYRTIPGIYRFATIILSSTDSHLPAVQNIILPAHHLDKPGDKPKCKGFALVTLFRTEDVDRILEEWPWKPIRHPPVPTGSVADLKGKGSSLDEEDDDDESVDAEAYGDDSREEELRVEARILGFRTLSKRKWDELKDEYLAYRQRLLDEAASFDSHSHSQSQPSTKQQPGSRTRDDGEEDGRQGSTKRKRSVEDAAEKAPPSQTRQETRKQTPLPPPSTLNGSGSQPLTIVSPYPPNCLLFVRNVHPSTNKTTLRTLFSRTLTASAQNGSDESKAGGGDTDGLDYVDFTKGMDSCYLRVATPDHNSLLVEHFATFPIIQRDGLDAEGAKLLSTSSTSKGQEGQPIEVEAVTGKKEDLYWDKVPEKIRRAAVERALRGAVADGGRHIEDGDEDKAKRKRKRKKY